MKTLHMMVGLPRSGKSTVARALGHPIVCPDAIRQALHGTPFREEVEPLVWGLADTMVKALFAAGHQDVTLDACNVTHSMRHRWLNPEWTIRYYLVATPEAECRRRARRNRQEYLLPVIKGMAAGFQPLYSTPATKARVIGGVNVKVV